ncbi:hydroxyisourate hydrolase [Mycolicibacterium aubagnense]|uniref:5-hydroxyisourate hydrolase n=1 Tax=Mycolicibacterium aubagnense TaxID=319707 RepID=A0ABN5YZR0_9MYCO|nr:hydroxyisourate hydrolase [Mycolicibacterium aubagnense]TLH65646.1 hydroxyisourate hydrolase [Mycolicibacterium aubagnense]WGI31192.1 hydroxyisourate hydrolase [Mycolicibacterium aubagnense]BBX87408.1 5-hydroxyisourate hydrolase [Mycolicibacterium aubagnense]
MTSLSTHVLDAARGEPAADLAVVVSRSNEQVAAAHTDSDGRIRWNVTLSPGDYRLHFATGAWFASTGRESFYPTVELHVTIGAGHTHVALLLSPFAYTTYRGS